MRPNYLLAMFGIVACSGSGGIPAGGATHVPIGSAATVTATVPASPGVKVTLGDVGLDASSIDRTADPCVDFYQFACGGWLHSHEVPPDRAGWSRAAELDADTSVAIANLLERGFDADTKPLGDFYASCMDEAAIERAGVASLKPRLDAVKRVADARRWFAAIVELHKLGVWVVWADRVTANTTYLGAGALGLPDRAYYVAPEFKDTLADYKRHVARLLALGGGAASTASDDVLAIETELAILGESAAAGPVDAKRLAYQVKSIDWKAYWKAVGGEPSHVVVASPRLFAQLDGLRAKFKYSQWASYFTYHLLSRTAYALPKPFEDEAFERTKLVTGMQRQPPRSQRCVAATQHALGDLLARSYGMASRSSITEQAAAAVVDALVGAVHDDVATFEWMTAATRDAARQTLERSVRLIGYPDRVRPPGFEIRRDDFAGNVLRAMARAGVDRAQWPIDAYPRYASESQGEQVPLGYEPTTNTLAVSATTLQPPWFDPARAVAANLGGLGVVVGHELIRGFDGAADLAARASCVADQYSTFEALPSQYVRGRATLAENIADIGGVKLAFEAYRRLRRDAATPYIADGFDEDQQFFLAVGQARCAKDRPIEARRQLMFDSASPAKFRVYGALRNVAEFAVAFRCAPGTPMRPAHPCSIW